MGRKADRQNRKSFLSKLIDGLIVERLYQRLLWAGSTLCILVLLGSLSMPALASEKSIEVERQGRDEPVFVSRITYGGVDLQCGLLVGSTKQLVSPFEAGDDWLQKTTIYLQNRTNKTISFARIALIFPETGDGTAQKPTATYNISLGRIPDIDAFSTRTGQAVHQPPASRPIAFAPGQTIAVNLADYASRIKQSVRSIPFAAVTKVFVHRTVFYFDGGMRWDGAFAVPDPVSHTWNRMPGRYFPGIPPKWPPQ